MVIKRNIKSKWMRWERVILKIWVVCVYGHGYKRMMGLSIKNVLAFPTHFYSHHHVAWHTQTHMHKTHIIRSHRSLLSSSACKITYKEKSSCYKAESLTQIELRFWPVIDMLVKMLKWWTNKSAFCVMSVSLILFYRTSCLLTKT